MEKLLIISCIITFLYTMIRMVMMKYFEKQMIPLKFIIRDATLVFCSNFIGLFTLIKMNGSMDDFFNIVTSTNAINLKETQIFTDAPGF